MYLKNPEGVISDVFAQNALGLGIIIVIFHLLQDNQDVISSMFDFLLE